MLMFATPTLKRIDDARGSGPRMPLSPRDSTPVAVDGSAAGAPGSEGAAGADGKSDPTDEWRVIATSLMAEGVGLLERLCNFNETAERQCLLGSAYKRQAWIGMGDSVQDNLTAAAKVCTPESSWRIDVCLCVHGTLCCC